MTGTNNRNRVAMYPGSFDLLTNGHLDLIERSCVLFDQLIVAVGRNTSKMGLFTPEERMDILETITGPMDNVSVIGIDSLTVDAAREHGAGVLIRGLRAVSDFEFELQLSIMNHELSGGIETLFMAADAKYIFLSSRMVKDVWRHDGDISNFVPPAVRVALAKKKDQLVEAGDWPKNLPK